MKTTNRWTFLLLLAALLLFSCKKERLPEMDFYYGESSSSDLVSLLNNNILNLKKLAECYLREEKILSFDDSDYEDEWRLFFESGTKVLFAKLNAFVDSVCPSVSMVLNDSVFLWTINGELLLDSEGAPYEVGANGDVPVLSFEESVWNCQMGEETWVDLDVEPVHQINMIGDVTMGFVVVRLPSDCTLVLPCSDYFAFIVPNVPNQAYYKNVFLDAGIGLTSRKRLYATTYLGLSLECMSFSSDDDYELQNRLIEGDSMDYNGRLLYPDGQPRYQLLFVNGGGANTHGQSLTEQSHENMRLFHENGGSYVGTCAGSSFASCGFNGPNYNPYYLHIWPEFVKRTNLLNSSTGFIIEHDSPLLNYYDFGGDFYLDSVRHNNGNYPSCIPAGGEVLARYDYPSSDLIHQQPSAWAYKANPLTGRIIQIGSHPEEVSYGERLDFTAASILYAIDGRGNTQLKGFLQNGIRREMTKSSLDHEPCNTMIGDLQCHHFVFFVPENAVWVNVSLKSEADVDMTLMLNQGTYAYPESAQFVSSGDGPDHDFTFQNLTPGIWYVGVQCNTTVTTTETSWGQEYSGRTDVLNGVPYSIKVSWTTPQVATVLKVLDR